MTRDPDKAVWYAMLVLAAIFALVVLCSCSTTGSYAFESAQPVGASRMTVVIEHRMAPLEQVITTCTWKVRESAGVKLSKQPLACSWNERATHVVLCAEPRDFNDHALIEACGHEDMHFHNLIDHK
jgi:hypothetical protein